MRFFFFFLSLFLALPLQATQSVFEYLTEREGVPLQLDVDLTTLINEKKKGNYFAGTLKTQEGEEIAVEVRARGKFRRIRCEMPPLKLKFSKKNLRSMGLDTLNEVKLVVPCFDDPGSEACLLREYAAYQIYEQMAAPYAVRARLIRLTIRDNHVEKIYKPVWCMLTEHSEEVSARLKGSMIERYNLPPDSLVMESAALNAVFQYAIGNTDWDIEGFRNVYLFQPADGSKVVPIPYDFDFSGLVSAPYSTPTSSTGLTTVKDRYLMKEGLSKTAVSSAVQKVLSMKKLVLQQCINPFFPTQVSDDLLQYLNGFFFAAESSKDLPIMLREMR